MHVTAFTLSWCTKMLRCATKKRTTQSEFLCGGRNRFKSRYSEAVAVRVHDLPHTVPHTTVANSMMKYGKYILYKPNTGNITLPAYRTEFVRVLLMRIKHLFLSYLTIANEIYYVEHLKQTCMRCTKPAQPKQRCVESIVLEPTNKTVAIATTTTSFSEHIFTEANFPPMSSSRSSDSIYP